MTAPSSPDERRQDDGATLDGPLRVLLVDDDPDDCFFHERAIRRAVADSEVVARTGVDEALDYLRSGVTAPDFILLDINMPKKSGWDFLDEYGELEPAQRTSSVVVMLTSSRAPAEVSRAEAHPLVTRFETKPLSLAAVMKLIEQEFRR